MLFEILPSFLRKDTIILGLPRVFGAQPTLVSEGATPFRRKDGSMAAANRLQAEAVPEASALTTALAAEDVGVATLGKLRAQTGPDATD
jgi:hypothetical protein